MAITGVIDRDIVHVMTLFLEVTRKFAEQGADVITSTPQAFGQFVESEIQKWTKLVKAANIRIEN